MEASNATLIVVDSDMPPAEWYNLSHYKSNYTFFLPYETTWDRSPEQYNWYRKYGKLLAYWTAVIYIIAVFLLQKIMSYRQRGFHLQLPLAIFSLGMAIFSILGVMRMMPEFSRALYRHGFEHSFCISSFCEDHVAATWYKLFGWSKYVELIDTLFLILRKRPVNFIHWYHHATVLVVTWHGIHTFIAAGRWWVTMNYIVHSIMYSYFAWRALGYGCPRWIPMSITSLQLAQMGMALVLGYNIVNVKLSGRLCHHPWENLYLAIAIFSTYIYLFARFFYFSYIKRVKQHQDGGYHLILLGNDEMVDGYKKDYESDETELRRRSAKKLGNDITIAKRAIKKID